jgi:hypothetical protein
VKVHNITGPIFFKETINTYQYVWLILTPLFGDLTVEGEMYGHLMVHSAIFYTVNSSRCSRRNSCYAADKAQRVAS